MTITNKKRIIHIVFGLILLITFISFFISLMVGYSQPADDIFGHSMDLAITLVISVPVFVAEIEMHFNALYFFTVEEKKTVKTVLNIIGCVLAFGMIISTLLCFLYNVAFESLMFILLGAYLLLRIIYFIVCEIVRRNKV